MDNTRWRGLYQLRKGLRAKPETQLESIEQCPVSVEYYHQTTRGYHQNFSVASNVVSWRTSKLPTSVLYFCLVAIYRLYILFSMKHQWFIVSQVPEESAAVKTDSKAFPCTAVGNSQYYR